jgi:hypothetical protein
MTTLAIFVADPDGWPGSRFGVVFRDDSTVGDDPMQVSIACARWVEPPMEL